MLLYFILSFGKVLQMAVEIKGHCGSKCVNCCLLTGKLMKDELRIFEGILIFHNFLQLDASKPYQYTPPTQPPIRPPYQEACLLRKNNLLAKEDAAAPCPSQQQEEMEAESSQPV